MSLGFGRTSSVPVSVLLLIPWISPPRCSAFVGLSESRFGVEHSGMYSTSAETLESVPPGSNSTSYVLLLL